MLKPGRCEPIEQPVEIADGAGLELDRRDGGRGSDHEYRHDPLTKTAILNRRFEPFALQSDPFAISLGIDPG